MNQIHLLLVLSLLCLCDADYWSDRLNLLKADHSVSLGANINLNSKEQRVNDYLTALKSQECSAGFADPSTFPPAMHIFHSRAAIESSPIFELIQELPKGGLLHSHDVAIASFDYVYNLTFRDNLYACINPSGQLQLHFFKKDSLGTDCNWELVSHLRATDPKFDPFLRSQLSLVCSDPATAYPSINPAWAKFLDIFTALFGMLTYRPVFKEYFLQVLHELYEDNVKYLEMRGMLPELYDLEGGTYNTSEVVQLYMEATEEFKASHPDFMGVKLIYAPGRRVSNETFNSYVNIMLELHQCFPDFVAGFDLVSQEDLGEPLKVFIPNLLELAAKGVKFFFHAGETNWNGMETDENLFDAILLNTTRIGHGYGLLKHPKLLEIVKQKQIAVEVSPISNQVLKLVDDLRNHPAVFLLSGGYPVVITSDDPGLWGVKGLSYDWYVAFMGLASCESDLRLLKQLAMNSIVYSALTSDDKLKMLMQWQMDWNKFINNVVTNKIY